MAQRPRHQQWLSRRGSHQTVSHLRCPAYVPLYLKSAIGWLPQRLWDQGDTSRHGVPGLPLPPPPRHSPTGSPKPTRPRSFPLHARSGVPLRPPLPLCSPLKCHFLRAVPVPPQYPESHPIKITSSCKGVKPMAMGDQALGGEHTM